jgi:hypothetical protein
MNSCFSKEDVIYISGGASHIVTNRLEESSVGLGIFVPGYSFDFWLKQKILEAENSVQDGSIKLRNIEKI